VESTLGLAPGALQTFSDGLTHNQTHFDIGQGSALATTFTTLSGGRTLTFDWNFWRDDYPPFNDFSVFTISGAGITGTEVVLLSDVNTSAEGQFPTTGRGPATGTDWRTFGYTLPSSGTYSIGFGAINGRDSAVPSYLHIDNIQVVPEVSTPLVLFFFGAFGIFFQRKR
jgi:hypothetical protein